MYKKYNSIEIWIIDMDHDMNVCALGIKVLIYILFISFTCICSRSWSLPTVKGDRIRSGSGYCVHHQWISYILIIQTESSSFQSCQSSSQVYDYLILCKLVQSWLLSGELMQEKVDWTSAWWLIWSFYIRAVSGNRVDWLH